VRRGAEPPDSDLSWQCWRSKIQRLVSRYSEKNITLSGELHARCQSADTIGRACAHRCYNDPARELSRGRYTTDSRARLTGRLPLRTLIAQLHNARIAQTTKLGSEGSALANAAVPLRAAWCCALPPRRNPRALYWYSRCYACQHSPYAHSAETRCCIALDLHNPAFAHTPTWLLDGARPTA